MSHEVQAERLWRTLSARCVPGRWQSMHILATKARITPGRANKLLRLWVSMGAPLQLDAYRGVRCVRALTPLAVSRDGEVHFMLDSSNTLALERLVKGLDRPRVFVAEFQRAGRGRMARRWQQGLGCGLSFSLAIPTQYQPMPDALSLRVGVGVASALQALGVRDIRLKWPNDLLWHEQKMGGILVEARSAGVVIGVGLNHLRAVRAQVGAAVSLEEALGRRLPTRSTVLAVLLHHLRAAMLEDESVWRARFTRLDALSGRAVRVVERDGAMWHGVAQGLDAHGGLRVQTAQGVRLCHAAEVSVRADAAEIVQ
ncbi:MAG: biotin--[acetyl-CoA-carboxylase] ligase [Halothiobacillaceae bacterium]|nr:biotin--[acetyl-CoA-carboxylase] ligase [Halothiobacillaceae bacterium]